MRNLIIVTISFLFLCSIQQTALAQTPAKPQKERVYIKGGIIHVGNGQVIENGTIGFENGKIIYVGQGDFKTDETNKIITANGKHVYPGIIALNTYLGLSEIEAVRATNDAVEVGMYNPNVRAVIAYNTDSKVITTVRTNGVLYAQIAPQGGRISGTSGVVNLDAWNWEDAAVKTDDGIFLNWMSMFKFKGWWAEPQGFELNKDYDKQLDELKNYFREASSYAAIPNHEKTNLRFEAMRGLFNKTRTLYVRVDYVKEIENVLSFAEEFGIKLVVVGGQDSYMIAELLAQKHVPVILSKAHQLPSYEDDDIDQPYKTPAVLQKAGVLFSMSIGAFWQERNLAFEAGTACAFGLSKEEALSSITANSAKILGLQDRIGTLEQGKEASILISSGDILDMKTSNIETAFIAGRQIDLNNKQKDLYHKYMQKYGLE